jgi:hypothetical protein
VTAPGNENVGGLDVAVDDAADVGGFEGVGNLDGPLKQIVGLDGFFTVQMCG